MNEAPSILIVEDDADLSDVMASYLGLRGYVCVQAYSGSEAALRCAQPARAGLPFDVIVSDLMLPGLSGEELIASLRAESDIPIIVVSAKGAILYTGVK